MGIRRVLGVAAALAALLALVPGSASPANAAAARDHVVLQVPFLDRFQGAGYVAALEKGFFDREGLDVELRASTADDRAADAVVDGRAQYGVSASDLVYQRLQGAPLVVLAPVFQHSNYALVVRADSGIRDPRDLVGRRVGIEDSPMDAPLLAMLQRTGVDLDRVDQVPNTHSAPDLAAGRVDAVGLFATSARAELRALGAEPMVLAPSAYGVDFYGDALFTSEQELAAHRDRVERMRRAVLLGWEYALRHPDELADLLLARRAAEGGAASRDALLAEAAALREYVLPDVVPLGTLERARYRQMAATLEDLGFAQGSLDDRFFYEQRATDARGDWLRIAGIGAALALVLASAAAAWSLRLRALVARRTGELERREAAYRLLAENNSDVISRHDPDGVYRYVSPSARQVLGYEPSDLIGRSAYDLIHPDDLHRACTVQAIAAAPGPLTATYRMRRADGGWGWVETAARAIRDESGAVLEIQTSTRDVGARHAAEQDLEARAAQQAAVARLGLLALDVGGDLPDLLQAACAVVAATLDVDAVQVLELDAPTGVLRRVAAVGVDAAGEPDRVPAPTLPAAGAAVVEGLGTVVAIRSRDGTFGVLAARARDGRALTVDAAHFLQAVANVLASTIERVVSERELQHQALHDALTGLPNRALLRDRLDHALARASGAETLVAVLFLDLDHFKVINDSAGHATGDELLLAVAERLRGVLRPGDTAARFGGDEFVLLCEDLGGEQDALAIAERVVLRLREPFRLAGEEFVASASVGVAIVAAGADADAVLRDADAALYRAKTLGRSRYEVFDATMRARAVERMQIESGLRRAVERGELVVALQPIVALADGSLRGFEALLRWRHPERGLLAPGDFIEVAEETNLIQPIGRWVLQEACRHAASWNAARPDGPPLRVAVNLSTRQLAQPEFPDAVQAVLDEYGLDRGQLVLEMTESILIDEAGPSSATLETLASRGVPLALDDFGTGYSSLGYLRRFPLAVLKFDRAFLAGLGTDPVAAAIVGAVAGMGQALDLDVVAEGVETAEQAATLAALGCPFAQGFHFARPLTPEQALELVRGPVPWVPAAQRPAG